MKKYVKTSLNENSQDPFIDNDGWNKTTLEDIGLIQWLDDVQGFSYEINNARRGSYAIDGDTSEDLLFKLEELKENLESIIDQMHEEL